MTEEEIKAQHKKRYSELFSKKFAARNVLSWGIWTCYLFGYFGFVLWMPSIFISRFHFTLAKSLSYIIVIAAVGVVGRFLACYMVDKVGRKPMLTALFFIMTILALCYIKVNTSAMLLTLGCIWTFFAEQLAEYTVVYVPELYPTHLRSIGAAFAIAPGRCAAALSSIICGALLGMNHYNTIWILFAVLFLIGGLITLFLGIETKGRQLEDISE